jgi:hypothetical protein
MDNTPMCRRTYVGMEPRCEVPTIRVYDTHYFRPNEAGCVCGRICRMLPPASAHAAERSLSRGAQSTAD